TASENWRRVAEIPDLFSGDYNDLSNKLSAGNNISISTTNEISAVGTDITASLNSSDVLNINSSTGSDATVDMTVLDAFYKYRNVPANSFDFDTFTKLGTSLLSKSATGALNAPSWYSDGTRTVFSQLGVPGLYALQIAANAGGDEF